MITLKSWLKQDKLSDDTTLKNAVISIMCIIKGGDKYYVQLFLEALVT